MRVRELIVVAALCLLPCVLLMLVRDEGRECVKPVELICEAVPGTDSARWRCFDPVLEDVGG